MTIAPAAASGSHATTTVDVKAAKKDGGYIVFVQDESGYWTTADTYQTKSASTAIRKYAEKHSGSAPLTLVAIPARSFRPVKVTANTVTKLVVEDVKP